MKLPAHVGRGVAVVIHYVRPGDVRGNLEQCSVPIITPNVQVVPEACKTVELIISSPIPQSIVLPLAQPANVVHQPGLLLPGES